MKIEANENGNLVLSEIEISIGIKTNKEIFWICPQEDQEIMLVKDGEALWSSRSGPFCMDPIVKATSLRPPPERVVVEDMPTADSNLDVREFDEVDETPEPEYVAKHKWSLFHDGKMIEDGFSCEKCGEQAPEKDSTSPCPVAEAEHTAAKLANCFLAARGEISDDAIDIQGAYGWSATYEAVKKLRAERDNLREALATCERAAVDDSSTLQGTADAAIFSVMDLCADRDRIRSTIAGLRDKVLAHLPCVCSQNRSVCHRHEIAETLDDFERRAGVARWQGSERDNVTAPAAEEKAPGPCDPKRIKDKLVIRFDSLPGPEPAGFVETEVNGKGVNAGEWVQDGEYWLLVIHDYDPKTIADLRRENHRLKARAKNFRDELAARAMQALVAKGPDPDESHGNQKRILAFHAYLYADEMLKAK